MPNDSRVDDPDAVPLQLKLSFGKHFEKLTSLLLEAKVQMALEFGTNGLLVVEIDEFTHLARVWVRKLSLAVGWWGLQLCSLWLSGG